MAAILVRSMMQNQCQVKVALEPLSPGIGPITCDLQRSVNILILQLDTAADDANDAHAASCYGCNALYV